MSRSRQTNRTKPTLYLVCGIPLSGKTTIARLIAEQEDAIRLCYEEIRNELFPGQKFAKHQNSKIFGLLQKRLTAAIQERRSIVVDAWNSKPEQRIKYAERAKRHGYRTVCIFCRKHYTYAIHANHRRGPDHPSSLRDQVIVRAFYDFIPPNGEEGWNEIHIMDGNQYSMCLIAAFATCVRFSRWL